MRKNPCVTCRELKLAGWVILLGGILTSASLGANPPATGSVTLVWDPSPDLAVVGYRLYEGLASSDYTVVIDVGNSTTGTASNLNFGSTYYFAVTDYDGTGEESPSSGEISYTVVVDAVHNGPVLPGQGNLTMAQYSTLLVTNTATDTDFPALALNYSLANPPVGAVISTNGVITWTPGPSQGHTTNLLTTVVTDAGVTPLSATNSFAVVVNEINVAPVLPVLADQALAGLQPLLVTNTASALDMPPVTLSYQLVGAPPTAAIDANGVITWTPAVADVPSTNVFTTVVTDNNPWAANAQQLSATNSFTVMVNLPAAPAPEIQSITVTDSLATITWASTPSRVYRLQCVDSLGSTNWQDLTLDVSAAAPTTAATDDVSGVASRFYRVQLVP